MLCTSHDLDQQSVIPSNETLFKAAQKNPQTKKKGVAAVSKSAFQHALNRFPIMYSCCQHSQHTQNVTAHPNKRSQGQHSKTAKLGSRMNSDFVMHTPRWHRLVKHRSSAQSDRRLVKHRSSAQPTQRLVKHGRGSIPKGPSIPGPQGRVQLPPQVIVLQRGGHSQGPQGRGRQTNQRHAERPRGGVEDMHEISQLWLDWPHGGSRRGRIP